jgi:hypothetical protein
VGGSPWWGQTQDLCLQRYEPRTVPIWRRWKDKHARNRTHSLFVSGFFYIHSYQSCFKELDVPRSVRRDQEEFEIISIWSPIRRPTIELRALITLKWLFNGIFAHPSLQFQSKFVFECANNVSTLRVVTYYIWTEDRGARWPRGQCASACDRESKATWMGDQNFIISISFVLRYVKPLIPDVLAVISTH